MGLKPNKHWHSLDPFTKVNSLPRFVGGNFHFQLKTLLDFLPSALADGLFMLL